jgi:hypothetical protein
MNNMKVAHGDKYMMLTETVRLMIIRQKENLEGLEV